VLAVEPDYQRIAPLTFFPKLTSGSRAWITGSRCRRDQFEAAGFNLHGGTGNDESLHGDLLIRRHTGGEIPMKSS
jgi:hypothetical protein